MKSQTKKKTKVRLSEIEKLELYEELGLEMCLITNASFIETQNISSLKACIAASRMSMQAMKDKMRYKVSSTD